MTTPSNQLKAIKRLCVSDGISWTDAHDIGMWVLLAGANFEMLQFSDKTLERIAALYHKHFEE
ncbi:MAG: hypothetical protein V4857_14385 [Pseudomonadota bacterium]